MHSFSWEERGVYWRYYGTLGKKDVIAATSEIYGDRRFDSARYILVDMTAVDEVAIDDKDIEVAKSFTVTAHQQNGRARVALISGDEELRPILGEFLGKTLSVIPAVQMRLFSSLAEARAWAQADS